MYSTIFDILLRMNEKIVQVFNGNTLLLEGIMKKKQKRLLLITLALSITLVQSVFAKTVSMDLFYNGQNHAYSAEEVKIMIDGEELIPEDIPPVIIDERTMLPMRLIAEALGSEVLWNAETEQVFIINNTHTVTFTLGSKIADQNGVPFELDIPAIIINDRTMLPVRGVAEALDLEIIWDHSSRTVYIGAVELPPVTPPPVDPVKPIDPVKPPNPNSDVITIDGISFPSATTSPQEFRIEANNSIFSYEEIFVDDSKIVIDIYNAKRMLPDIISETNSGVVSAIRTAEHMDGDKPYTRVVLDLVGKKNYKITQSSDKKEIIITFKQTVINEVAIHNQNQKDTLVIEGDGALGAQVSTITNPSRLIVKIPNVQLQKEENLDVDHCDFITDAKVSMINADTMQVELEINGTIEHEWKEVDGGFQLEVTKSTLENFVYDGLDFAVELTGDARININDIKKNDQHTQGYYEVILPGDYKSEYGYGTIKIDDSYLKDIIVETKGNNTIIRFNQNRYNEYVVEQTSNGYAIHVKNPQEVYDKVLLLDAGHGGGDPGTNGNGLVEKNIALSLALKVEGYLKGSGIKIYQTRNTDVNPDKEWRAATANDIADFMVSIHLNAAGETGNINPVPNGTETLYKVLSNEINVTSNQLTSKKSAQIMQNHVLKAMDSTNRGLKERTDLLIFNASKVPMVILEVGFLTNPGDALKLSKNEYQDKVAKAIAEGIIETMDTYELRG